MEEIKKKDQLYKDKLFTINAVKIDFGNGNVGTYELIESSFDSGDGVIVVPVDENNKVYLLEQYQVGADKRLLILPRGGLDKNSDPDKQANEELREEIGYRANKLTKLVRMEIFPGWYKGASILYLAQDLIKDPKKGDELEDLKLRIVDYAKISNMIQKGEITDARTIAGLLYVKDYLSL